ncbi:helix-turn-helix domain-containing protein [Roseiconus nitratireducens]|uniref:Helix-turn-helix domain-containing protein n=1 Tax=Roseiconus nitratireducens TaxID=2605748 RepID=A0A5M6D7N8_9BACT|nr:helix-turn-helix domain-containing protein [Roseiconus nitratireducens]KAA5543578.1 helix-turn-helix domain-containing protein [Roseiconus nitratireducens]
MKKGFSVPSLAERWGGCSIDHVRNLIAMGELRAINIGTKTRKTWIVPADEVEAFEERRSNKQQPKTRQRLASVTPEREWV